MSKKISDIVRKGSIITYPYKGKKVICMVRNIENGIYTLLPVKSQDKITSKKGMNRNITTATPNRLAEFSRDHLLYQS